MRLEQLQAFLAVAETGSFQQAARQCNVTQSTISRQIQALEAELGLPLLHRTARATLTLGGECFVFRARKICQEWETARQELNDLLEGKQSELCVAAIHSVCAHYLPPILQHFCQEYPDVQLRVTALGSDRALKVLKDGLVDLAIVMNNRYLTTSPGMVTEPLYDETIDILMAANHPLASYDLVPWQALTDYPHAIFKDGYGMQRLVQEMFARRGGSLKAALELNSLDAFRGVVRQGNIIALLPQSALLDADRDPSLAVRPIVAMADDNGTGVGSMLTREVVLVTTRDRMQIPPIRRFYQLVLERMGADRAREVRRDFTLKLQ